MPCGFLRLNISVCSYVTTRSTAQEPPEPDTMCLREEIPVVGWLREFLPFWEKVFTDQWVLNIIQHGYSIELLQVPHFNGVCRTNQPLLGADVLSDEVDSLLHK